MDARTRASLLWGAVAAMAFLVLVQGYDVVVGLDVSIFPRFGVALGVFAAGTAVSYLADRWLAARAAAADD